ncbi:mucin-3B-like [Pempheris klunzingeri]|uniref:mucin-3B-like n=1 Tax=Pempheris klunzingeri TaxID=3127111 RepID=UPI00398069BB
MTIAWVRSENKLARLLPICFAVNTKSLQSEPRCVWLYQREIRALPAGTELKCEKTEMTLLLPVASLSNIDLTELQLNSPTCPVSYNNTHLTAHISLDGCGTKTVHSGSELVYTNTLRSVRPYTMVSRQPSLILPLACRIPGVQAKGPHFKISIPTETETFGYVRYWIELHFPGEGPMSEFTRTPRFRLLHTAAERVRRNAESPLGSNSYSTNSTNSTNESNSTSGAIGSKIKQLDLHVMSNTSIDRAEMLVSNCIESETEDFTESHSFLKQGCTTSNTTLEIVTTNINSKVYRLDMTSMQTKGSTMYIRCTVNLCIATMPSDKCPDLCASTRGQRSLVGSVFSRTYTITSGPISLVVTAPTPATPIVTTTAPTTKTTIKSTTQSNANSHVQTSAMAAGVILITICTFLQNTLFY